MKLVPALFESMYCDRNPFGLGHGKMGGGIHNAGWYSIRGEFLAWGDICAEEIEQVSLEIDTDEAFIIVREDDWRDLRNDTKGLDYKNPGLDFLMKHALVVVQRNRIIWVIHPGKQLGLIDELPRRLEATPLLERSVRQILRIPADKRVAA